MRRSELESNPDLYELFEKTSQLKKNWTDEKVWKCLQKLEKHIGFKEQEFSDFFIGPVFFYRNPPPHLRGRVRASFCRERRLKTGTFYQPELLDPKLTCKFSNEKSKKANRNSVFLKRATTSHRNLGLFQYNSVLYTNVHKIKRTHRYGFKDNIYNLELILSGKNFCVNLK